MDAAERLFIGDGERHGTASARVASFFYWGHEPPVADRWRSPSPLGPEMGEVGPANCRAEKRSRRTAASAIHLCAPDSPGRPEQRRRAHGFGPSPRRSCPIPPALRNRRLRRMACAATCGRACFFLLMSPATICEAMNHLQSMRSFMSGFRYSRVALASLRSSCSLEHRQFHSVEKPDENRRHQVDRRRDHQGRQ